MHRPTARRCRRACPGVLRHTGVCCCFFFFQAEDGIRDLIVTGVQTCALPICGLPVEDHGAEADAADQLPHVVGAPGLGPALLLREVHAQELAGVGAGQLACAARGFLLARSLDGRWGHTATGVFPGALDGRPRMVSGSSALVVFEAMKAGLTSKGFRLRCALKRASDTPDCTSPLSMPTSLVVQMSLDGPRMIAPASRSPRQRSFR